MTQPLRLLPAGEPLGRQRRPPRSFPRGRARRRAWRGRAGTVHAPAGVPPQAQCRRRAREADLEVTVLTATPGDPNAADLMDEQGRRDLAEQLSGSLTSARPTHY